MYEVGVDDPRGTVSAQRSRDERGPPADGCTWPFRHMGLVSQPRTLGGAEVRGAVRGGDFDPLYLLDLDVLQVELGERAYLMMMTQVAELAKEGRR